MEKGKGCFRKGDIAVTWAFGHILGMAMPELYGEEYKVWSNYPILPSTWLMKPDPQKKEQLDIIKGLIKDADVVVHAGDPDREGQLLIDEILDFLHYKGEVRRILINAKDDESLKRAFASLRDNKDFYGLYAAGLGRARADWLIGMNLSRAYTVNARKAGHDGTYRIGRVKVPTLALVVQREKDILSVSCKMKSDTKKGQAEAPVVECFCKPNNTERGILHVQETFYHKYTKLQASNCFSKRSDTGTLEGGIA